MTAAVLYRGLEKERDTLRQQLNAAHDKCRELQQQHTAMKRERDAMKQRHDQMKQQMSEALLWTGV